MHMQDGDADLWERHVKVGIALSGMSALGICMHGFVSC